MTIGNKEFVEEDFGFLVYDLCLALDDFVERNSDMFEGAGPIESSIRKALFEKKNIPDEILNLAERYDIFPAYNGFFLILDKKDRSPLELHDNGFVERVKRRIENNFDRAEIEACKDVNNREEFLKRLKDLKEGRVEKNSYMERVGRIRKGEEEKLTEISERYGKPFFYVGPEGLAYFGRREEAEEKLGEVVSLLKMLGLNDSVLLQYRTPNSIGYLPRDPTLQEVTDNLEITLENLTAGNIPDFNPSFLEGLLLSHVDSFNYGAVSRNSSPMLAMIGLTTLILSTIFAGLGLNYYFNSYLPEQRRREPYRQAGGTEEQINQYFSAYPKQNGNSSYVGHFSAWVQNRTLAEIAYNSAGTSAFRNVANAAQFLDYVLPFYSQNSGYIGVLDQTIKDRRVGEVQKLDVAKKAVELLQNAGIVSLNPYLMPVPGNVSAALVAGYPGVDFKKAMEALQQKPKAADIGPIPIANMFNRTEYLPERVDYQVAYWMLSNLLGKRPDAINQTTAEEIATAILANQYDLIEAGMTPEEIATAMVRHWDLVPRIGERLMETVGNETDRRIVLYYKRQMPLKLYDKKTDRYYDGRDAVSVFLQRLEDGYDGGKIFDSYPDGKIGIYNEDPRLGFYGWLDDRFHHGLAHAVGQLLGLSDADIQKHLKSVGDDHSFPEFLEMAGVKVDWNKSEIIGYEKRDGTNYLLRKEWQSVWDKVEYYYGYIQHYEGEWNARRGGLKIVFTLLDEPIAYVNPVYDYSNIRASGEEFTIFGVPDSIARPIKQGAYNKTLLLPGNGISLGSMVYGIEKDLKDKTQEYPLTDSALMLPYKFTVESIIKGIYLYKKERD